MLYLTCITLQMNMRFFYIDMGTPKRYQCICVSCVASIHSFGWSINLTMIYMNYVNHYTEMINEYSFGGTLTLVDIPLKTILTVSSVRKQQSQYQHKIIRIYHVYTLLQL